MSHRKYVNMARPNRAERKTVTISRKELEGKPIIVNTEAESNEGEGEPVLGASTFKRFWKKNIEKAHEGREGIDW